ncbi:MAG: prephenate dehydratase domain-containing protein [Oscillospiraceae bacterium]|nr:prephenate dehydratase domain-containing protein [Oscillospiraceae bacterium]
MNLEELRKKIDEADSALIGAFCDRMSAAAAIAAYKKEHGLPVSDPAREREKLRAVCEEAGTEMQDYVSVLYALLFELSRAYQGRLLGESAELPERIGRAIAQTPQLFPPKAQVACQGVEGAYSQTACERLFRMPSISYVSSFEAVFSAIESGLCQYGVIPLENSTAGSVNMVYDLMLRHNFYITRSVRVKISHNLLAPEGVTLGEVREIFSHEQAISQCSDFLATLPGVTVTRCANTAAAAKLVSESGRRDAAALSSRACAELYHLCCLCGDVQNQGNNYTRFICISRNLEIFPGADRTSIMMVLPHRTGSLYKVLARFYALGINLNKLESRPIPDRDFEFMFYFDLDTSVYSPEFRQLMGELQTISEEFTYLGSYQEVI